MSVDRQLFRAIFADSRFAAADVDAKVLYLATPVLTEDDSPDVLEDDPDFISESVFALDAGFTAERVRDAVADLERRSLLVRVRSDHSRVIVDGPLGRWLAEAE